MSSCGIIFLYGAPASGKTTLGQRLASALKSSFVDLDAAIVDYAGKSISEIFSSEGEEGFRNRESAVLSQIVSANPGAIISLGGGTLLRDSNRALCERSGVIWCLDTPSDDELARRFQSAPCARPLGNKAEERAEHYASFTNRIDTSFLVGDSLVIVGSSIAAAVLPRFPLVADATVADTYSDLLSALYRIPSGEEHKTIGTVANIWKAFAEWGLGRQDVVCALGGGVTGDLTGFAAATWMRGIDWINVPTTLLAMVDASVGGKTGCDLPEGKNLAGSFHPPRLVVIDTDFLKTLPANRLADGLAEMIKHWIINNSAVHLHLISPPSPKAIAENLMVKVNIVREDPLETKGKRILLNCGHTIAHAVEKLSDYKISHGEAVAIGCVEEAKLAVKLGLAGSVWPAELAKVFAAVKLPTALPEGMNFESLKPVMRGDKKHAGDTVTFSLPCGWGDVRTVPVEL